MSRKSRVWRNNKEQKRVINQTVSGLTSRAEEVKSYGLRQSSEQWTRERLQTNVDKMINLNFSTFKKIYYLLY